MPHMEKADQIADIRPVGLNRDGIDTGRAKDTLQLSRPSGIIRPTLEAGLVISKFTLGQMWFVVSRKSSEISHLRDPAGVH